MNTTANKINSTHKANTYTALMFALATLLLVVSCPVKRFLQNNFVSNTTSATKTNQTNINHRTIADYNVADNCSLATKEAAVVKQDLSKQVKLPLPLYLSNINNQTGFDINYFLSGINVSRIQSVYAQHATLSLFLQHLRLLI